jgi:hypothetical protein
MFVQPLLQWKESNYYILWEGVCSLSYTACSARALYRHLWSARLYCIFVLYLINGTILKIVINIKCVVWLSLQRLSETFLILRRTIERDVIKNVRWYSCQVPFIIVRFFKTNLNILDRFSKNTDISNVIKICAVGVEFHEDGQTCMTKPIVALRNFANAPKNRFLWCTVWHLSFLFGRSQLHRSV